MKTVYLCEGCKCTHSTPKVIFKCATCEQVELCINCYYGPYHDKNDDKRYPNCFVCAQKPDRQLNPAFAFNDLMLQLTQA